MRLLNTRSLELESFLPSRVPDYVILSHRWQGSEELTFENISRDPISNLNSPARLKRSFSKVQGACKLAVRDGYDWIWIDSCCIDKSSSAELQESINSMWNHYARSNICYVYLVDVPNSEAGWDERFQKSEWFTRGWTLQELIAPAFVEFYAEDWSPIGTKLERYEEIASITSIDPDVLVLAQPIDVFSAAEKFSWASHRQVTREEDEAYCLMGLFDINMPMLYGEGGVKAFIRLQEAIYNSTVDHSLFLFSYSLYHESQPLLADCPTRFCQRPDCEACKSCGTRCFPSHVSYREVVASPTWSVQAHEQIMTTVTPYRNEMSATISLIEYPDVATRLIFLNGDESRDGITHVAVLYHTLIGHMKGALCLLLVRRTDSKGAAFRRTRFSPAILPYVEEFTSKLQRIQILICPGPIVSPQNHRLYTTFALDSDAFLVQSWSARCVDHHSTVSIEGSLNTAFKIQTSKSDNTRNPAKISCRIAHAQSATSQVSLQLARTGEIWSIKEVLEVKLHKRQHKKTRLFLASTLSDRCSVRLSDGGELIVALRRLGASGHVGSEVVPQRRYQIAVRCSE